MQKWLFQEWQPKKFKFNENGPYYYRKQTNSQYSNEKKHRKLEKKYLSSLKNILTFKLCNKVTVSDL